MKKIKQLFLLLSQLSGGRWGIAVVSAILPVLMMVGFGLFLAIQYDYLLILSICIAVSTLLISLPLWLTNRHQDKRRLQEQQKKLNENSTQVDDSLVKVNKDWSTHEVVIWEQSKIQARQLLSADTEWRELDKVAYQLMNFVAQAFDKKGLDFSIPEGLQLLEEISRRYQLVVKEYIPAIELVKISHLTSGYKAYEQYGEVGQKAIKVAIWANYAKNLYLNPAKFATDLLKDQSTSGMTQGLFENIQIQAKQALLDEVVSVAIDLYSGRFSFEQGSVTASDIATQDVQRMAADLEPIRIVIVGQTNAGKSSVINVLKEQLMAEVDVLPCTDGTIVYQASLDDIDIRLIDLQGLDGKPKTEQSMLAEMTSADLILWMLKADQPARALDKNLKTKFDAYYDDVKHISSKKATVVGIVNQVDRLKPIDDWQPPYDLIQPDLVEAKAAKAKIIKQAMDYNQTLLMPDKMIALSISPNKPHFGIESLKNTLQAEIENANNVQRNRQRREAIGKGIGIKKQFDRVMHSGKKLYPNLLRAAAPKLNEIVVKKLKKKS
ncbi:50S ribosome-binding GTPase [Vibrio sp. 2-Bac 85]